MSKSRFHSFLILAAIFLGSGCQSKPEPIELMASSDFLLRQGEAALRQNEFDLALADRAEKLTPKSDNLHFLRARIYSEVGQWQKAETSYRQVLELAPGYRGVWNNLGNNAFRQQKYHQAIAFYQKELETNTEPIPWRGMGRAYVELGKVDSAQYSFQHALMLDSLYAPAHFTWAVRMKPRNIWTRRSVCALSVLRSNIWKTRGRLGSKR